jgi:hypothetical protein
MMYINWSVLEMAISEGRSVEEASLVSAHPNSIQPFISCRLRERMAWST